MAEVRGTFEHLDGMLHSCLTILIELRDLRDEFAPVLAALRPRDGKAPSIMAVRGAMRGRRNGQGT